MDPRIDFADRGRRHADRVDAVGDGPAVVLMPGRAALELEAEWRIPVLRRALRAAGRAPPADPVRRARHGPEPARRDGPLARGAPARPGCRVGRGRCPRRRPAGLLSLGHHGDRLGGAASGPHARAGPVRRRRARLGSRCARPGPRPCSASSSATGTRSSSRRSTPGSGGPTTPRVASPPRRSGPRPARLSRAPRSRPRPRWTSRPRRPRSDAPALVLHRRHGQVIPIEVSRGLADSMPNGRLEILPGSSGGLFFEGGRTTWSID